MRARVCLEELYKKQVLAIQHGDSLLMQVRSDPRGCYQVLQEIGRNVVEVESMRIYAELLKKIEDRSAAIVNTGGDIALLRVEANWFRCLLWYRKCKDLRLLDDLHTFCYNFFKGTDLTSELSPLCEIFLLYPMLRYMQQGSPVPLGVLYSKIQEYLQTRLEEGVIRQVMDLDRT